MERCESDTVNYRETYPIYFQTNAWFGKSIELMEMVLYYTVLEKTPKAILKINEEQEIAVHSWNPWHTH